MDELVETSISNLQESELITVTSSNEYKTTEYGDIMSKVRICVLFAFLGSDLCYAKFYIRLNTVSSVVIGR